MKIQLRIASEHRDLYPSGLYQSNPGEDAAFDLRATNDVTLPVGATVLVPTGVFANMSAYRDMAVLLVPRSNTVRTRVGLANTVAVVDPGYQGEWLVFLCNNGDKPQYFKRGDRICQALFVPIVRPQFELVDDFGEQQTSRGAKGFGSSGETGST